MQVSRRSLLLLSLVSLALSFAEAQTPLRLVNVVPCRLADTRSQNNGNGFHGTMTFDLRALAQSGGVGCTPFSLATAQAYSLNVTLVPVNQHPVSYLTIWPTGQTQPLVSLMNSDGRIKANAAIVPGGTNGQVSVFVTDTTNVLVDIDAYFDAASDPNALTFYSLQPCRLVDTRENGGPFHGTMTFNLPQSSLNGGAYGTCSPLNLSSAQAYSLNITALPVNGSLFYLTVWPDGQSQPVVSTLNDAAPYSTVVANAAIVPAGTQQLTNVYATDQTNLLIDINGYFAPASGSTALSLYNVTPCRVLDTRSGIGLFSGTIPVGVVGSACGIPNNMYQAFVLNATVVPPGPMGYLTLWPPGAHMPVVSTLNAYDGALTSNMAIVPSSGVIDAFAYNPTQLILDISSYFSTLAALVVETTTLPDGTMGSGYSVPLVATGGVAPYSWLQAGGHLPPGLSISSAGTISGTPTSTGTYMFGVEATDSNSPHDVVTGGLQIIVNATQHTLGITTMSLPSGTFNVPYNALLAANGGVTPYTWSISSGGLPPGLGLVAASGQITGTPQAAGLWLVTVKVTDAQSHTATAAFDVAVNTGSANPTLSGMYAFSFTGYQASTQTPFVVAGSLLLDGEGDVVSGEYDFNDATNGAQHATVTDGSYMLSSDGLGQLHFRDNSGGDTQLLIAVGSGEDIRIISMNTSGTGGFWGAGVFRQQNPADFNFPAAANWTLGTQGFDGSGHPLAVAGTYNQAANGNISNGDEEVNDFGTISETTFTGSISGSFDANGRTTAQTQVSGVGTLHYAVYVVSANHVIFIQTDNGNSLAITNALRQSGSQFNNGSVNGNSVGSGSRVHSPAGSPASQAVVLLIQASNGNLTVTEDVNTGGTVQAGLQATGTYTVAQNGRTVISLNDGNTLTCYLVALNQAYCINSGGGGHDVQGAQLSYVEPQAAGPFNNAYLFGQYLGGSLPQYVSTTDSTIDTIFLDGIGAGALTYSQSGPDGVMQNQTATGTYSIDSTGAVTLSSGGSALAYGYVVGRGKFVMISLDNNPRALIQTKSSAP